MAPPGFVGGILISMCECPHDNGAYKLERESDVAHTPGRVHYGMKGRTFMSFSHLLVNSILRLRMNVMSLRI